MRLFVCFVVMLVVVAVAAFPQQEAAEAVIRGRGIVVATVDPWGGLTSLKFGSVNVLQGGGSGFAIQACRYANSSCSVAYRVTGRPPSSNLGAPRSINPPTGYIAMSDFPGINSFQGVQLKIGVRWAPNVSGVVIDYFITNPEPYDTLEVVLVHSANINLMGNLGDIAQVGDPENPLSVYATMWDKMGVTLWNYDPQAGMQEMRAWWMPASQWQSAWPISVVDDSALVFTHGSSFQPSPPGDQIVGVRRRVIVLPQSTEPVSVMYSVR